MSKPTLKPQVAVVLAAALLTLLAAGTALAQSTGSISGLVQDPAGASIPKARVTAKNLATTARLETTASESGTFEFPAVALGNYEITVESPGFKRAVASGVVVNVSLIASVVIKLQFRVEGLNVLNHPNFGNPGTDVSNAGTFGFITSTTGQGSRLWRGAIRLGF